MDMQTDQMYWKRGYFQLIEWKFVTIGFKVNSWIIPELYHFYAASQTQLERAIDKRGSVRLRLVLNSW